MALDPLICLVCVGEKLVMSWWSWESWAALPWERKAQILLLGDCCEASAEQCACTAPCGVCVGRNCLGGLLTFMLAVVALALSEDFIIHLKVVHAASFAALFDPNLIFSESRDSWGLSARYFLPTLLRRAEYSQLNEVLPK